MGVQENKAVVRRFFDEMVNERDMSVAEELFAEDFVIPGTGYRGPEGAKAWVSAFRESFSDSKDTIVDQAAEGDKVITVVSVTATHDGEWLGQPPTGKTVSWRGVAVDRLAGGKIVERYAVIDLLGVARQLGIVSAGLWSTGQAAR